MAGNFEIRGTYTSPKDLGAGQIWIADTHLAGFNRPWFNALGWGMAAEFKLLPGDFYSEALYSNEASSKWDGALGHHYVYLLRGICIHNKSHNLHLVLGLNYVYIFP